MERFPVKHNFYLTFNHHFEELGLKHKKKV